MENLFKKWKVTIPKYDKRFRSTIFDVFSKKFGGSEKTKVSLGKHFSNNYELYMYAFFLGLYNDEYIEIPEEAELVDFSHAIQFWGNKSKSERKDFSNLQEYMFMAVVAKTDFDMVSLEKGKITVVSVVKKLRTTMESYTNGGLNILERQIEENKGLVLQPTFFLDMILDSKIKDLEIEELEEEIEEDFQEMEDLND